MIAFLPYIITSFMQVQLQQLSWSLYILTKAKFFKYLCILNKCPLAVPWNDMRNNDIKTTI